MRAVGCETLRASARRPSTRAMLFVPAVANVFTEFTAHPTTLPDGQVAWWLVARPDAVLSAGIQEVAARGIAAAKRHCATSKNDAALQHSLPLSCTFCEPELHTMTVFADIRDCFIC